MRVRAHLAWLVAAILVPVVVLTAVALGMLLDAEREAARRGVRETARAISLAVDQELATAESALRVLANSAYLTAGDFSRFYQQAAKARTTESSWILLYGRDGQQLVNTRVPFGTALPVRSNPERMVEVLKARHSSVSNLYLGTQVHRSIVTVDMPVEIDGVARYVLAQAFIPGQFQRLLTDRSVPENWIVELFDRNHVTLARSHRAEEFVGEPGSAVLQEAARKANEGAIRHPSREGIDIYDVFTRSSRSGWIVAIGVPIRSLETSARRAVLVAGLGVLCALGAAIGVAFLIGRGLTGSIARVAQSAAAVGRGESPPPQSPSFDEIDGVHAALSEASANLLREKAARAQAEAERERLLASEQAARELAEAQNRAKDEFLAMLGHELRNPLSAISGAVSVLQSGDAAADAAERARDVVARQAQHLSRVVDDLLDLSRVMTGKIMLDREPVDLGEAVRRSLDTLQAAGRTDRHAVTVRAEPVWVHADTTRLDQIITNLLTNALKYTPENGSIDIEVGAAGEEAVLTVCDSGIGISERLLPQVFDVFVQGAASLDRAQGGMGLGLALVRRLAMLHGGTASAASEGPGRGSAFTVRMPRMSAPSETPAAARIRKQPEGRRRVLIVDDHDDSRSMMCMMLKFSGYEPLEARDGLEGVERAATDKPDVAIVDIGLPGIDGYEVARRIRAGAATRNLPLIALTGYGQDEDRRRSLEAGFDLHLVKPVEFDELAAAIATAGVRTS